MTDAAHAGLIVAGAEVSARRQASPRAVRDDARVEQAVAQRTAKLVQQIEDLETFCRSVAHDLRNPLFVVEGFARLLLQSHAPALSHEAQQHLQCITRGVAQLSGMLDGLRALSEVCRNALRLETFDLAAMAREVAAQLACRYPQRDVAFTIEALPPLASDPRLLRIVLQNLLDNAWKYTAHAAQAAVHLGSTTHADGSVTYYVRDNGIGFAPSAAAQIFLPFKRLSSANGFAGSGIGLASVKRIVDKLGGRVWAQATPGSGATFYFALPPNAQLTAAARHSRNSPRGV